jgi:hypothetical protein
MTLQEFVRKIRAGEMIVPASRIEGDTYATVMEPLTLDDDLESITAEAFQNDVFDPDETSWEDAVRMVRAEIG